MEFKGLIIHKDDNVAVALTDLQPGDNICVKFNDKAICLAVLEHVPCYHKIAICDILPGQKIYKYGEIIGQANCTIPKGAHVHVHNVVNLRGRAAV